MDRIAKITNRAKAQGSQRSKPLPVKDGVADKVARDLEWGREFFEGRGNYL